MLGKDIRLKLQGNQVAKLEPQPHVWLAWGF